MSQPTASMTQGDTVVVNHCRPANANTAENAQQHTLVGAQRFIKAQPQALGTIQIIIGIMVFLFGIAIKRRADNKMETIAVNSGFFVWGAAFYITAGSLTVAAARRPSRCLVNCAMAFSILAVVTAATATILYSLDAAGILLENSDESRDDLSDFGFNTTESTYNCGLFEDVSGVLTVFNVLQLVVSAVVIGYACYAACSCREETFSDSLTAGQTAAPTTEEMQYFKGEASTTIPPHPPSYNTL